MAASALQILIVSLTARNVCNPAGPWRQLVLEFRQEAWSSRAKHGVFEMALKKAQLGKMEEVEGLTSWSVQANSPCTRVRVNCDTGCTEFLKSQALFLSYVCGKCGCAASLVMTSPGAYHRAMARVSCWWCAH